MRAPLLALAMAFLASGSVHAASGENGCVLAAARNVPNIGGVKIVGVRTESRTAEEVQGRQLVSMRVLVDLEIADRKMTMSFGCSVADGKASASAGAVIE